MTLLSILGVLSSAIFSGTSLLFTTLGEVIDERAGIVNLGLEGVLLVSASSGFAITSITGYPLLGILAAMLAGGLMNLILGYLVITRRANQLASGLALMFFGFGLSALIGKPYVGVKITSLGPVRAKMIRKGMVYSPAHGDMAFTVPLFDEFMMRAIPELKR